MELKLEHLLEGDGLKVDLSDLLELTSLLNNAVPMSLDNSRVSELLDERKRCLEADNSRLKLLEGGSSGDSGDGFLELTHSRFLNIGFFFENDDIKFTPGDHGPLLDLIEMLLEDIVGLRVELVEVFHLD